MASPITAATALRPFTVLAQAIVRWQPIKHEMQIIVVHVLAESVSHAWRRVAEMSGGIAWSCIAIFHGHHDDQSDAAMIAIKL